MKATQDISLKQEQRRLIYQEEKELTDFIKSNLKELKTSQRELSFKLSMKTEKLNGYLNNRARFPAILYLKIMKILQKKRDKMLESKKEVTVLNINSFRY